MERSHQSSRMIPVDVATQWNSTLHMIKVALKLRIHLDAFCSYIYTEEVCSAFTNCSKIVQISHEQWFLLQNVCKVLDPFDLATNILSGEKHPTLPLIFPVLQEIKNNLMQFAEMGGVPHADWFENATETVEVFRKELLNKFKSRFQGMSISLLWTVLLDPRLTLMNGFTTDECARARTFLLDKMKKVPSKVLQPKPQQCIAMDDENGDYAIDSSHCDNYIMGNIFSLDAAEEETQEQQHHYSVESKLDKYLSHCRQ